MAVRDDRVEQAKGPILNPIEMGMTDEKTIENKIQSNAKDQAACATALPDSKPAVT